MLGIRSTNWGSSILVPIGRVIRECVPLWRLTASLPLHHGSVGFQIAWVFAVAIERMHRSASRANTKSCWLRWRLFMHRSWTSMRTRRPSSFGVHGAWCVYDKTIIFTTDFITGSNWELAIQLLLVTEINIFLIGEYTLSQNFGMVKLALYRISL